MKNLLRLLFLSAIMAFITPDIAIRNTISCAPAKIYFRATITSVKSGVWSDPTVWSTGTLPTSADKVTITTTVNCDVSTTIAGALISPGGKLRNPQLLQSTGNIINTGVLEMVEPDPAKSLTLRFTGINENNFVGGGMDVLDSDVGLWTMGAGQLVIKGASKTSWTRLVSGVNAGANQIVVQNCTGWQIGDELSIVPTAENDYTGFEERIITGLSGTTITLNQPLTRAHPMVNNLWTAEVMNLTRNVNIEGTATGRSHIFIRSTKPSSIEYAGLRYLGPRKNQVGNSATEAIQGRYALHVHHSMDGSRGALIRGNAARDIGNHVYVPHVSHGIRLLDNIAYNILGSGFWWDEGFAESSHDIRVDKMIVAKCDFVRGAVNVFDNNNPKANVLSARAYMLNHGDDDTITNSVAVGVYGDPHDGGGFKWEAVNNDHLEGVWNFKGNRAHNIEAAGLISWQNVQMNHLIQEYTTYHSREGLFLGAYANPYQFQNSTFYKAKAVVHAGSSTTGRIRFENCTFSDILVEGSSEPGLMPILFRNCKFDKLTDEVISPAHNVDIIQSTGQVIHAGSSSEVIRIQPSVGQAARKAGSSTTNISTFAPAVWSNGKGLKGEYFTNTTLSGQPAFVRTDSYLGFSEWGNGVHYKIGNTYSVRWTGYFQAQFNEKYTVTASAPGSVSLYINSTLYTTGSASLNLEAGKWYAIKIEYKKTGNQRGGMQLGWKSPSIDKFSKGGELIPMCQLNDLPGVSLALGDRPIATLPRDPRYSGIKLLGNPVTDIITVQIPAGEHWYQIMDMQGRLLRGGRLTGNLKNLINVSEYARGLYVLKIIPAKSDPVAIKVEKN